MVGSAGSLYGDQAVGGVVNIITRSPAASDQRLRLRAGSYDFGGAYFSSSSQVNESFGYRVSGESSRTDNYRDHNAQEYSNIGAAFNFRQGANQLFAELQTIVDDLELPGALLEDEFEDDPRQINAGFENDFRNEDTRVYRLGYERELGAQSLSIDTARRKTDSDIRQSFRNNPSPEAGFLDREIGSVNVKLSGSIDLGYTTNYVVGVDLDQTDLDFEIPNAFGTSMSSSEQDTDSVYFQLNPRITQALQLTFGMRLSRVENDLDYADVLGTQTRDKFDDEVTVGELGLVYRVDDATRITLRYDENFRFAKVDELTFSTEAGTLLDTQTGESWELGLDLARGSQRIILSVYQLDLEGEIAFDPSVGPDFGFGPTGLNVNFDQTRRRGATLSWQSQLSREFSLNTEIGLVDAKFRSGVFDGKDISGVADQIVSLRGDYQMSDAARVYLEYNYSSPKYAQGDNANELGKLASITVYNAGAGYRYQNWDFEFRVNNLADESYAELVSSFGAVFPNPERNYMLTAGYRFE